MGRFRHTPAELAARDGALFWARTQFGFTGVALPRGRRESADECPLALATGAVVADNLFRSPHGVIAELPHAVSRFVHDFDRGRWPELVRR